MRSARLRLLGGSFMPAALALVQLSCASRGSGPSMTSATATSDAAVAVHPADSGAPMDAQPAAYDANNVADTGGDDGAQSGVPDSGVTPPGPDAGYVFDDEFNGTAVDTSLWTVANEHGDTSNGEPECYFPANVSESGGYLHETVKAQSAACPDGGTVSYVSGAVQMKTFNFLYGTVEFRVQFAGGTGPWPAVWLLGADCQQPTWLSNNCPWPNPGSDEIDIAEVLGSRHGTVNEEIHSSLGSPGCGPVVSPPVDQAFHVYRLVWKAGSLTFLIDGTTFCTLTQAVPSHPMFLIMNLAVGGAGGTIDDTTLPQTTLIDYVRVTSP